MLTEGTQRRCDEREFSEEPDLYRFATTAMATEFVLLFPSGDGHSVDYLSRAATECFTELGRLEAELSRYKPNSDISRINRLLAGESARVGMAAIDCLGLALAVREETAGAFDITVGQLMDAFGSSRMPSAEDLRRAKTRTGGETFRVDYDELAVTALCEGLALDLGGLGKGYALDQLGNMLETWGIDNALVNAGDSTVLALGSPPGEEGRGWPVRADGVAENDGMLCLRNQSLSGSGFLQKGAHIMDPRKGRPVAPKRLRTWAVAPTAAMSDALSTAFSVMTKKQVMALCRRHEGVEALFWK